MTNPWTSEQVTAMAPDAGAVGAGRKLGKAALWKSLGRSDTHLWGEIKGSGSNPYQTCIDILEPAFKCSCPSRKFPCKHALGLSYVWSESSESMPRPEPPEWVAEWIAKRSARDKRSAEKAAMADEPVDEAVAERRSEAQKKRSQTRMDRVREGTAFLRQWLVDVLRQGVAKQGDHSYRYWDELAARMVDAQAPGLARYIRRLAAARYSEEQWQGAMLDVLARIHLLLSAFERMEDLDPVQKEDVTALLGIAVPKEGVLKGEGVRDLWQVVGKNVGEEDGLRRQSTWLWGERSSSPALVVDFAAANQVLPAMPEPGTAIEAELVFYPGAWQPRALIREQTGSRASFAPSWSAGIHSMLESYAGALRRSPWLESHPAGLHRVVPVLKNGCWYLVDDGMRAVPLLRGFRSPWELLTLSGGDPVDVFGEFDGSAFLPLSVWCEGRLLPMPQGEPVAVSAPPGPDPLWKQLVASALLGTERQQKIQHHTGPLGDAVEKVFSGVPDVPEQRATALLNAAALATLYRRSGQLAIPYTLPLPIPALPDAQPQVNQTSARLLRMLLEDADLAPLIPEFLVEVAAHGKRLPEALLPALLGLLTKKKELVPPCAAVLGERGRWLARLHPCGAALTRTEGDEGETGALWEEGDHSQRLAFLVALRRKNPAAGRELVEQGFPKATARERASFIEAFETGLESADEPFLESCTEDKSVEVRRRAALLLARIPGSLLSQRLLRRAEPWLVYHPPGMLAKLAGKSGSIELLPPDVWEAAWTRDGLVEKPPQGKGARAWWLEQTLALVPPSFWSGRCGIDAAALLRIAAGHEWSSALLPGWRQAMLLHRDEEWAVAFLEHGGSAASQDPAPLWEVLPRERSSLLIEERMVKDGKGDALANVVRDLQWVPGPWESPFSAKVIDLLRDYTRQSAADYAMYPILRACAVRLSPDSAEYFEKAMSAHLGEDSSWCRIVTAAHDTLKLRSSMISAIRSE